MIARGLKHEARRGRPHAVGLVSACASLGWTAPDVCDAHLRGGRSDVRALRGVRCKSAHPHAHHGRTSGGVSRQAVFDVHTATCIGTLIFRGSRSSSTAVRVKHARCPIVVARDVVAGYVVMGRGRAITNGGVVLFNGNGA
eukprot:2213980-Prymnesium_polylepis.1